MKIPAGSLVLGAPAKVVRALSREERAGLKAWAEKYVENSAYCLKNAARLSVVSLMKKHQKRVLVALGWYDYRLHRGIERYALEHGWNLSANLAREKVIPWGWEGDGILAWLGAGDDLAEFVSGRTGRRWISVFAGHI